MSVVVVGDVMLDVFEEGRVERISPEAPVPILHNPRGYDVLGGAANMARNIDCLGIPTTLIGLVGDDDAGARCRSLTLAAGLTDALTTVPGWRTVMKHRFIAGGQQILRVDTEDPLPPGLADVLLPAIDEHLAAATAVVLSDYDKGAITAGLARVAITAARKANVPIIVDSKRRDVSMFRGCTIIAPNHLEATRMTGISDPGQAATLIASASESAVLVTLGADGMLLFHDGKTEHVYSQAREVADVTGAGDSVTAGLTVGLVEGRTLCDAAKFANAVAAIAVAHKGTYAVTRADVRGNEDQ